jgi:hypothetical protein
LGLVTNYGWGVCGQAYSTGSDAVKKDGSSRNPAA